MPSPTDREAGFTLLELLVVVLIAGLVLGMLATGARGGDPRLALEAAAQRLGDALATARSEAILHDRPVRVVIAGERLPAGVRESFSGPEKNSIVFQGDGSASGGVITLAGRGGQAAVTVDWLTGRIRVVQDRGDGTEGG